MQNRGLRRYAQSLWLIGAGGRKVLGKLALFCKKGFCTSRATPGVRAEFPQPARLDPVYSFLDETARRERKGPCAELP